MTSITQIIINNAKNYDFKISDKNLSIITYIIKSNIKNITGKDEYNEKDIHIKDTSDGYLIELNRKEKIYVKYNQNRIELSGEGYSIKVDSITSRVFGKVTTHRYQDTIENYYILEDDTFRIAKRINQETEYHLSAIYQGSVTPTLAMYKLKQELPEVEDKNVLDKIKRLFNSHTIVNEIDSKMTEKTFEELTGVLNSKANSNLKRVLK